MPKKQIEKPANYKVAETIIRYYLANRGVGHTRVMMEGIKHRPDAFVLLGQLRHADMLDLRQMGNSFNVVDSPNLVAVLMGRQNPLIIDHFGLQLLLQGMIKEYDELDAAYGGCHNCYGKGYASVNDMWSGNDTDQDIGSPGGRVSGGNPNAMKFCKCERGKQLESRWKQSTVRA